MDQDDWRSIMDLKLRIREAEGLESLTAVAASDAEAVEMVDPTTVSRSELDELIRREFGLPERVTPAVEEVLTDAIDELHAGDIEAAGEHLEAAFESPCERRNPPEVETSETHRIACLLQQDEFADARTRSIAGERDDATADD